MTCHLHHEDQDQSHVEALEEAQDMGSESAEGRQERVSEANEPRMNVEETGPADLYRSHDLTRTNTGRWTSIATEAERFWSKVDDADPAGCWMWLGQVNQWGYGHFRRTPRAAHTGRSATVKAHRFAYELLVGPIPPGLTLDHLCGQQACVRPDHLEPVTNAENVRRRHARRRTERTQS